MTGSIWMLHAKKADFNALAGRFHISPVTARIIRNRDIESEAEFDRYLNGSLEDLYSPGLLPDMEEAVQRICRAVQEKRRLRIVGIMISTAYAPLLFYIRDSNGLEPVRIM